MRDLEKYVPRRGLDAKVEVEEYLAPVVERIARVLPRDIIWGMYSSSRTETGGVIRFPYSRVDSSVIIARNVAYLLNKFGDQYDAKKYREHYDSGCIQALEALVWVEVGFQGLQNLAVSPASVNWTSAVGHTVTPEQRAIGIMTTGKQAYEECLADFIKLRNDYGVRDDYFNQFDVEYLLDTIPLT